MQKTIFTVSELNTASQKILEHHFPDIWVEGEISNLSKPGSGHVYFSLKDQKAQIRAAFFRQNARNLNFELRNGLLIQVKARVSLYPDRGDYQLIVEKIEHAGEGLLRQAYEQLLNKLRDEGLFQSHYKQALPKFPRRIGIITSPTGAALQDILTVLKRRFSNAEIIIFPCTVQGANAAPEIVQALQRANAYLHPTTGACDVLLLCRGGGSLEDLWPFNEEIVARAIFSSVIPIVTGVGHETDFTIADFVADLRAPTPSAAAECISPDQEALLRRFQVLESLLLQNIQQRLNYHGQHVDNLTKRLRHPKQWIEAEILRLNTITSRLTNTIQQIFLNKQQCLSNLTRTLEIVSPLATLNRGYSIVTKQTTEKTQIIRSIQEVRLNDKLAIKVSDGSLACVVEHVF